MSAIAATKKILLSLSAWLDNDTYQKKANTDENTIDWLRCIPFLGMHVACLAVFLVGWSWVAVGVALSLYFVRMFAITGFYHRYFSHRTFRTSRTFQFVMAVIGNSSGQRGPLWWAAHHRHHHKHSDTDEDPHSPHEHGLLWSHMLWFTTPANFPTQYKAVPDLAKYKELRWLDRFDWVVPAALAATMFILGWVLSIAWPASGTNAWQMLVWGFVISTIVLFHGTCLINSMAHLFGKKRFDTGDESRNSLILSLITLGEGWHNNHHHYPAATRQGFYAHEIDITYYLLCGLEKLRIIWDLNEVPERILEAGRRAEMKEVKA